MRKPKLLAAFDDPGGALAVMPVLKKTIERGTAEVTVYAGVHSIYLLDDLKHAEKYMIRSDLGYEEACAILDSHDPDILLTATGGGSGEQQLRNAARNKALRSYVIIDFWKHYGRRWLYADHPLESIIDTILVMDEATKTDMMNEGFPSERIKVTGHPYLDSIFNSPERRTGTGEDSLFLFLSQPSGTIELKNTDIHPVTIVAEAVEQYLGQNNKRGKLIIKMHPLETAGKELTEALRNISKMNLQIEAADSGERIDNFLIRRPVVIGYNSIALFEARASGCKAISLDLVPMSEAMRKAMASAGIVFSKAERDDLLHSMNAKVPSFNELAALHKGATGRCLDLIFSSLHQQKGANA